MEKSHLRGEGLYCGFIDIKKAFYMLPREPLEAKEELRVQSEYMFAISQLYYNVICCVCIDNENSKFFDNTIGVK